MEKTENAVPSNQQTNAEIKFILSLGTNSEASKRRTRKELLLGYLDGSQKRMDWCQIDKDKVVNFAIAEIEREYAKNGA